MTVQSDLTTLLLYEASDILWSWGWQAQFNPTSNNGPFLRIHPFASSKTAFLYVDAGCLVVDPDTTGFFYRKPRRYILANPNFDLSEVLKRNFPTP